MSVKFFLDTNILVYTFDKNDRAKCKQALSLVGEALETRLGVISYQVVQEFVNVATKKFLAPIQAEDLRLYLGEVLLPMCEVHSSAQVFRSAMRIHEEVGFSFYDSLIVACAQESDCRILYSEDLQHSRAIGGVKIINPFK
jgi:predicted nucleic acid-binding protein